MSSTLNLKWDKLKVVVDTKSLSIQWVDANNTYFLFAVDHTFIIESTIKKTSPRSANQIDFEDNYKSIGNAPVLDKNIVKTFRKTAVAAKTTHTFSSAKLGFISLRNDSTEDIQVNFKDEDFSTEYITIKVGDPWTPHIAISKNTKLNYRKKPGVVGNHDLEIIAWG